MTINENLQPSATAAFTTRSFSADKGSSKMKSVQVIARITAVLYLVIAVAAGIAHGYVPASLLVAGDAAATAHNIAASGELLRMGGIGSELLVLLSEVVVTVLLYSLLKPVNQTLSLLA